MNLKQTAKFLKISKGSLYRIVMEGKIKATKTTQNIGWEISQNDLKNYLYQFNSREVVDELFTEKNLS